MTALTLTADRFWSLDEDLRDDIETWMLDELGYAPTEVRTVTVVAEGVIEVDALTVDDDGYEVDMSGALMWGRERFVCPVAPPHLECWEVGS